MKFDNRSSGQLVQNRRIHLSFSANGKHIIYCYIRKNACSSFKNMIVACSPHGAEMSKFSTALRFLRRFHTDKTRQIEEYDHSVFVVRNPLDRVVSVYLNKFIQVFGSNDIFESYAALTGNDPERASFRDFIIDYMSRPLHTLDPHVRPQSAHLLSAFYTDAILIDELHASMSGIVGQDLADRFFLRRVNSTSCKQSIIVNDAWSVPSCELRAIYHERDVLPATECLLSPELLSRIRDIYADDFQLFDTIRGGDRPPEGRLRTE